MTAEERALVLQELKYNWQRLLEGQFNMGVETWFEKQLPGDPVYDMFGADKEKWQQAEKYLQEFRTNYNIDTRQKSEKDPIYKENLNETLKRL